MSGATGRYFPVSYFRRLVADLMHFSAKVPSVTIERRMGLAPLVVAREACAPSPTWSAIFTKSYAVVAARTPLLRTSYLTFPWPRFYEHSTNIATLNIDRQLADERVVLYAHIASQESLLHAPGGCAVGSGGTGRDGAPGVGERCAGRRHFPGETFRGAAAGSASAMQCGALLPFRDACRRQLETPLPGEENPHRIPWAILQP